MVAMGGSGLTQSERWRLAMGRGGERTVAERLAEAIGAEIREGQLPAGALLPVEARLAFDLVVEVSVVSSAYEQLTAAGLLTCRSDQRVCVAGTPSPDGGAQERGATILTFGRVGQPGKTRRDND
jgi:DNA-binding FadR family transcriptional regulator